MYVEIVGIGAACTITALLVRRFPRESDLINDEQVAEQLCELKEGRLDSVAELFGIEEEVTDTAELWARLGGLAGLHNLEQDIAPATRILQACRLRGLVSKDAARECLEFADLQKQYTRFARVEDIWCKGHPNRPHLAARAVVEYHWKFTHRIRTLCQVPGAPACLLRRNALL